MFTVSCLTRLHITQIAKWLHAGLGERVMSGTNYLYKCCSKAPSVDLLTLGKL